MCLIAVAPRGLYKYDEEFVEGLRESSTANRDGIGFAYKRAADNKVHLAKGFKTFNGFLGAYKSHNILPEDDCVVHLRTGNKGSLEDTMCHPFKCASHNKDLLIDGQFGLSTDMLMFHNGTFLDYYSLATPGLSDSYNFAKDFMGVVEIQNILKRNPKQFLKLFEHTVKTNKLAFIIPGDDSEVIMLGDFHEYNGFSFSNRSYEPYKSGDYSGFNNQRPHLKLKKSSSKYDNWNDDGEYRGDSWNQDYYPNKNKEALVRTIVPLVINPSVKDEIVDLVVEPETEVIEPEITEIVDLEEYQKAKAKPASVIITAKLNKLNFSDFNYLALSHAGALDARIVPGRTYKMEKWNDSILHVVQSLTHLNVQAGGSVISYYSINTADIETHFVFIPKPEFKARYTELATFKKLYPEPSKSFMKRLRVLLVERMGRVASSTVFFAENKVEWDKVALCYYYFQNLSVLYKYEQSLWNLDIKVIMANLASSDKLIGIKKEQELKKKQLLLTC